MKGAGVVNKRKWTQVAAFTLAAIFMVALLGGCSTGTTAPGASSAPTTAAVEKTNEPVPTLKEGVSSKNGHVYYDPPITLNLARSVGPEVKFKPGQDINNNTVNDWMLEEFGIKVNYMWTTPTTDNAFYTKLMLSVTAKEELPEFFAIPGAQAHELIDSGLMMPVDDLFNQYAGDVWKNAMAQVPGASLAFVRDGKTYAYPLLNYSMEHEDVMWIRQDWLDAVNMKAPTNLVELKAVMDAFIKLPSSVTKVDKVYGFTAALKSNYTSWIGVNPIFGGFGVMPQIWMKDDKGEIVYGSTMPQMTTALTEFKDWIDKGYFPPEVGLMDEVASYQLFTSGRAGIAMGPTWVHSWPLNEVEANIEGAVVKPYPIPNGISGTFMQHGDPGYYQVELFAASAKNPQAFFEVTDYLFENTTDPAKGSQFEYGFKEGYDYVLKDGKASYKPEDIPDGPGSLLFFASPLIPSQKIEIAAFLADGNEPQTPVQIAKSIGWNQNFLDAAKICLAQKEHTIYNLFSGAPTKTMLEKWADLSAYEVETFSNILYGKVGVDEGFQQWLTFWNANGGPQITDEVREWYKNAGGK